MRQGGVHQVMRRLGLSLSWLGTAAALIGIPRGYAQTQWHMAAPVPLPVMRATARSLLKGAHERLAIERRRAFLVVVEIDVHVVSACAPAFDLVAPGRERCELVTTCIPAAGAMAADIDEIGRALPR